MWHCFLTMWTDSSENNKSESDLFANFSSVSKGQIHTARWLFCESPMNTFWPGKWEKPVEYEVALLVENWVVVQKVPDPPRYWGHLENIAEDKIRSNEIVHDHHDESHSPWRANVKGVEEHEKKIWVNGKIYNLPRFSGIQMKLPFCGDLLP